MTAMDAEFSRKELNCVQWEVSMRQESIPQSMRERNLSAEPGTKRKSWKDSAAEFLRKMVDNWEN